ncbi:hypothetical protein G9A89_013448 [Geosiphon pyriformis]|nr:hypothetical protein G9A89_013448 [Geosiphon pyriformis]
MVYGGRAYKDFFDYLKANSFLGLPSTVMLVAPEADAICAYKMLDILFRSENICYQCLAVTCDQDLVKCAKAVGADITILDDEPNQRALRQLSDAYYMVKVRSHENGPINDGDGRKSKRQKTEGEQEVGLNIQTDEEETRKRKGDAKKITDDYEKKPAYYSKSVAGVTYSLAGEISRTFNERHPNAKNLLWLAMVGLTSQFISNLIDQTQYEEQWKFFNEQLKVIKPSNAEIKPMHTITATNGSDTDIRSIMEYPLSLYNRCLISPPGKHL